MFTRLQIGKMDNHHHHHLALSLIKIRKPKRGCRNLCGSTRLMSWSSSTTAVFDNRAKNRGGGGGCLAECSPPLAHYLHPQKMNNETQPCARKNKSSPTTIPVQRPVTPRQISQKKKEKKGDITRQGKTNKQTNKQNQARKEDHVQVLHLD